MAGRRGSRLGERARRTLAELERLLTAAYGAPEGDLQNKRDPLEEAVYIILSFQTDLDRCQRVWARLRRTFPSWSHVVKASKRQVARVLREGGLQEQKASTIRGLLRAVKNRMGEYSLDALRTMDDAGAERILTSLPGLSWKGARCVLLYSLDRDVFPVDGNTFRVLKRVGVVSGDSVYRRKSLHDGLQQVVPPSRRRAFHVNLVVHGQRTCLPRRPQCERCAANLVCSMRGTVPGTRLRVRREQRESGLLGGGKGKRDGR